MNRLDSNTRRAIINCLIEGCSIRSTVRVTGAAKKTVMRALVEVGEVCARFQDEAFRNLKSKRIRVDELWAFCYCKEKNVTWIAGYSETIVLSLSPAKFLETAVPDKWGLLKLPHSPIGPHP